jgi:hypothetical protein
MLWDSHGQFGASPFDPRRDKIKFHHRLLIGFVIIGIEFDRKNYSLIFCNCDWKETEIT